MTKLSALLFDLDGTLVDSAPDLSHAVNHTLAQLGIPGKTDQEVMTYIGDGMKTLLERATGFSSDADLARAAEIFRPYYLEHCMDRTTLYPGALETLEHFKTQSMALVTNKPVAMTEKILARFGISKYFKSVVGGESTPKKKPDPEPVLKALSDLKAEASQAIMIGDGPTDMEAGRKAGTQICAVTYGYRSREELKKLNPNYMIDHLNELKSIVRAIHESSLQSRKN